MEPIIDDAGNVLIDFSEGTSDNDSLEGSDVSDVIFGYEGDDTIIGDAGTDFLLGFDGNDYIDGGLDDDILYGGFGDDTLLGNDGNDLLTEDFGNDSLDGGAGDDILQGFVNPTLFPDTIEIDTLTGGAGADTFVLGYSHYSLNASVDPITVPINGYAAGGDSDYALITDFNPAEDLIALSSSAEQYTLGASPVGSASDTGIFLAENNELVAVVQGVSISNFDSGFTFA